MVYESIRILAKKDEMKVIQGIFSKFESILPNMKVASKNVGEFSDRIVVSIKIDSANYEKLVEIFVLNGLKVVAPDDKTKILIDNIKKRLREGFVLDDYEDDKIKANVNPISDEQLEKLANDGDYEEIKRISKDIINFSENFVKKVGDLLEAAVHNAIEKAIVQASRGKESANHSIDSLLKISSDLSLRSFNKNDLRVIAGNHAIEIALQNVETINRLVEIANKNTIPNNINISAAVKFAEVVLVDEDFFADDIAYAIKHLNTKWLLIAYDVANKFVDSADKILFYKLIEYINQKK